LKQAFSNNCCLPGLRGIDTEEAFSRE